MGIFRRKKREEDLIGGDPAPFPGRGLPIGRLTWFGLAVALLGWAMLIGALLVTEAFVRSGSAVAVMAVRADVVTLGQTAIFSGFSLAVIGALRGGFGALNRFFEAVLQRSSAPKPATVPVVEPLEPQGPVVVTRREPTMEVERPSAKPERAGPENRAGASDKIKGRNYVILSDGSVEVDTLLGTRIFATLDEARAFIR